MAADTPQSQPDLASRPAPTSPPVGGEPARPAGRHRSSGLGYRGWGADWPFGRPERAHGVAMEGYYWRITDPATHRVVIALIGIQTDDTGCWALAGLGTSDGFWRQAIIAGAETRRGGLGARAADPGILLRIG